MALTTDNLSGKTHAAYDNVKETFPESKAPTGGTVTINVEQPRTVIGIGTSFTKDFNTGDYIWLTTTDELRRIDSISGDNAMALQQPISATITAAAFRAVKAIGYTTVSWANDATGVSNINGIPQATSLSASYGEGKTVLLIDSTVGGGIVNVIAE